MDPSQTPQTVAQAVQAATQQAAQQAQSPQPVQPPQATPSTIDNLTCQWQGCGERTDTAEALYDHVCERHVGRKSTNNLNLTCAWGACRTTTVKRDHITSHIRVHVPLKPHKCDFCGKSFKRPQDLKKHVKTHADDSVLGSPTGGNGRGSIGANGGMPSAGKANSSYYPAHDPQMSNPYHYQQHAMAANGGGYAPPGSNGQYNGYGSVSYPNNSLSDVQSMDTRRRAIEALNDFLGDIKRRAINPGSYYDVGSRLGASNALPLPVGTGYNTGYNNQAGGASFGNLNAGSLLEAFNNGDHNFGGGLQGAVAQPGYSLPNARTKNDLQDIDRFLEQLQATVYETSNQTAAAGVQQPGMHAQYGGDFNFGQYQSRSSNSPPNYQNGTQSASFGNITAAAMPGMPSSSSMDTPALTPASVSSYSSSGQSPLSSQGRASLGSMSGSVMYPSLPAVTGMSDLGAGYPTTTSAPAPGLASGFDGLDGRRYSGGRLQRQAPGHDEEMPDVEDAGNRTPKQADQKRPKSKGNSTIDPALRGDNSSDSGSTPSTRTEVDDKRQEDWIENIRTIETLRKWIGDRLNRGDYDDEIQSREGAGSSEDDAAAQIAKMVQARMADANQQEYKSPKIESGEVNYPSLPSN